jgi:hypothetical protein
MSANKIFKEIMAEIFPELLKKLLIYRTKKYSTPNKISTETTTSRKKQINKNPIVSKS